MLIIGKLEQKPKTEEPPEEEDPPNPKVFKTKSRKQIIKENKGKDSDYINEQIKKMYRARHRYQMKNFIQSYQRFLTVNHFITKNNYS